jgi:hypothetical protein
MANIQMAGTGMTALAYCYVIAMASELIVK